MKKYYKMLCINDILTNFMYKNAHEIEGAKLRKI